MKPVFLNFILNSTDYFTVQYQLTQSFYCGCPYEGIRVTASEGRGINGL